MSAAGKNLERFRRAVATHDVENPNHESYGIGMAHFDMERLGYEEGGELWSGYRIYADGKGTGNFRVLCDGEHDECDLKIKEAREKLTEHVDAVSREPVSV